MAICPCCGKHKKPAGLAGLGTALKPAMELICVARKPLSEPTIATNVLRWGTGALNIGACRMGTDPSVDDPRLGGQGSWSTTKQQSGNTVSLPRGTVASSPLGRWPANVLLSYHEDEYELRRDITQEQKRELYRWLHENGAAIRIGEKELARLPEHIQQLFVRLPNHGREEVVAGFPESISTGGDGYKNSMFAGGKPTGGHGLGYRGSAARFFKQCEFTEDDMQWASRYWYSSKANKDDRLASVHPTVKPLDLIQYLCRLVCPPKGVVLDCFAGTGTTGEAAFREGMRAILIEREPEYVADIARRMGLVLSGRDERSRASAKARGVDNNHGPLFEVPA